MPPNYFNVMSHSVTNLVEKLKLCGHVYSRQTYNDKKMNNVIKMFVNFMARPMSCIAKLYILEKKLD